jgi:hypothetical protein
VIYLKPQQRTIKRGMRGRDVMATKYAMKFALGKKSLTLHNLAGIYWERNLNAFKSKRGIKEIGYGPKTHAAMKPYIAKIPYAVWLWNNQPTASKTPTASSEGVTKRQQVVNAALYGAQHEPSIHYTQSSLRMYGVRNKIKPPGIPRYEDCSSFATWCYWLAGAADPNGLGYNGQGYTGTLAAHGKRVSTSQLRPGDLVFYGGGFPYTHVVIYIGGGRVVSHGSESGPKITSLFYRTPQACRSYLP